jgi:putative membrane protein
MMLTKEQEALITEKVAEAERKTSGEIGWAVFERCDDYASTPPRLALICILAGVIVAALCGLQSGTGYVLVALGAAAVGGGLGLIPAVRRAFTSKRKMAEEAAEQARAAFFDQNLDRTRDRNGILIFVAAFERQVVILPDDGINEKVEAGFWQPVADAVARGIRDGDAAGALSWAVWKCGDVLATEFPRQADDTDELPDGPIKG